MSMTIEDLIAILHAERCSCAIYSHGSVRLCWERGIKDLLALLEDEPSLLHGAMIADKVVGKGAAALMILGEAHSVYADVISQPALALLSASDVGVKYGQCVPNIINRSGTGPCPVEALCEDCKSAIDCLPRIKQFVENIK